MKRYPDDCAECAGLDDYCEKHEHLAEPDYDGQAKYEARGE